MFARVNGAIHYVNRGMSLVTKRGNKMNALLIATSGCTTPLSDREIIRAVRTHVRNLRLMRRLNGIVRETSKNVAR